MKIFACCAFAVCLASAGFAQIPNTGNAQPSAEGGQSPSFVSGRQLSLLCVHNHPSGDAGSTILYREKAIDADKLSGRIHVGRYTAILVRFTNVNTFCYDYEAGVTRQVTFYSGSMPTQLKPFFVGGLDSIIPSKGAEGDKFSLDQAAFDQHYNSYKSLGQLAMDIRKAFADAIDSKKDNAQIRDSVGANLKQALGYTDRNVTEDDLKFRQTELQAGIGLLTNDLANLRGDNTASTFSTLYKTQTDLIAKDEEAVGLLSGQYANYATAVTDLEKVQTAPDEVDRVVILDPKYDEYTVTASVALLKTKPTESDTAVTPTTSSSSIIIDVTGSVGVDFSTGIVATSPVSHDYYLAEKTPSATPALKYVMDGGARNPAFDPAAFIHYYTRPGPGQFALGPTFGVDLSSVQNFFFGVGLTRAGPVRFSLVGGLALNKVTLLDGDRVGQPALNQMSVQTKMRYVGGYFIGLSFNFGGF